MPIEGLNSFFSLPDQAPPQVAAKASDPGAPDADATSQAAQLRSYLAFNFPFVADVQTWMGLFLGIFPSKLLSAAKAPGPKAEPKSRAGFLKVNASPTEILDRLCPPTCRILLNQCDWRWTATWQETCELWIDQLSKRSFSRSFDRSNWRSKLQAVHEHAWSKWQIASARFPLPKGSEPQEPGHISPEIFGELEAAIRLPEPKKYHTNR